MSLSRSLISPLLTSWSASGEYIDFTPLKHQLFVKQIGDPAAEAEDTLLLIHGFPESSFSYHAVVDGLLQRYHRILLVDMIGYGHSDKPTTTYGYSLYEQADAVLTAWRHFGVTGGHVLAHDMGDSVATELLARREHGLLPGWLSDGLLSLTLTNGSMVLAMSKLRITQKLLISRWGYYLRKVPTYRIFRQQVISAQGNNNLSEEDINLMWQANLHQDGHHKTYLTIKYLADRKKYEKTRWMPALAQTDLPVHLCWGEDDQVARVEMAYHIKQHICPQAKLTVMPRLGHFCQLGSPDKWVEHILGVK